MDVEKAQRVPPFRFFRHCETFFRQICFSPKGPPSFFWYLTTMDVKKCERVPLLAHRGPASWPRSANSVQLFGFFRYCRREYLTLWSLCYFWALGMAQAYVVPGFFPVICNLAYCNIFSFDSIYCNIFIGNILIQNNIALLFWKAPVTTFKIQCDDVTRKPSSFSMTSQGNLRHFQWRHKIQCDDVRRKPAGSNLGSLELLCLTGLLHWCTQPRSSATKPHTSQY